MSEEIDAGKRLQAALAESLALREEVQQLKALLAENSIVLPTRQPATSPGLLPTIAEVASIAIPSSKEERVTLFRALFRGREDVYAERWRMKDGTWGYRPAGVRDWHAVNSSRPEDRKKVDRETRTLFPVTDSVIREHLTGKRTIGIYPLLPDDTCWVIAADFDKKTWQTDALAFLETCGKLRVPAGKRMTRPQILSFNWFVKGVEGSPKG